MAVTIDDIARETGYHRTTVSQVLNANPHCFASAGARSRISETAVRLGYRPNFFARGLVKKESRLIGIVGAFLGSETEGGLARDLFAELLPLDYLALFGETMGSGDLYKTMTEQVIGKSVDGLIVAMHVVGVEYLQSLDRSLPTVFISRGPIEGWPAVYAARRECTERATRRLIALGHRRIAYVANSIPGNREKVAGYCDAMSAADLPAEEFLFEIPGGPGAILDFVIRERAAFSGITAVLTSDDLQAVEVMHGLAAIGRRVPEDCSIVGFGDMTVARSVKPGLTTLRLPLPEVAHHAVRLLMERMRGNEVESVVLVPETIERETVAPPRTP